MEKTCETHVLAPYDVIAAWLLPNWTPEAVQLGEHCLYRAFATRFPRHCGDLKDDSNFVVSAEFDLQPVIAEVEADLRKIEQLIG